MLEKIKEVCRQVGEDTFPIEDKSQAFNEEEEKEYYEFVAKARADLEEKAKEEEQKVE